MLLPDSTLVLGIMRGYGAESVSKTPPLDFGFAQGSTQEMKLETETDSGSHVMLP